MNILYGLRRAKQFHGDKVAMRAGDVCVTYAQFYERVLRLASTLRGMGIERGDRVAVLMLNCPEYLELYYGVTWMGAVIVPLNTRWNLPDIVFALRDSESRLLVVDDRFAALRPQLERELPRLRFLSTGAEYEERLKHAPAEAATDEPDENDLAGLFYTSGTTGGPKGVMLTHRNLWSNALHAIVECEIRGGWTWLHAAPMFHLADGAFLFSTVMTGGTHCFLPAFEPEACLRAVERYRVTGTILVPTMVNMLVNHAAIGRYDLSSFQFLFYGASPMPLDVLRRAREKLGCQFYQGYGSTEASPLLTILQPHDHGFEGADQRFAPVRSAGRPILGVEVKAVDPLDRELPPGEAGEVVARGANIMKGYWNRPEINAETLRGGWLHTGDLGVFDERGYLYILDRMKDMIKPGGENVYSPEVESLICTHPDVLEVAVIGVPDEVWGEAIKAVAVLRQGRALTARELIEFCRERTTHFKCPTSVEFVEALPKGGTGKIQKNVLRERYGKAAAGGN